MRFSPVPPSSVCPPRFPGHCPQFAPTPLRCIFAPPCYHLALAICPSRCTRSNIIRVLQVFSQSNISSSHVSKTNSQQRPPTSPTTLPLPVHARQPPVRNLVLYNQLIFHSEHSHITMSSQSGPCIAKLGAYIPKKYRVIPTARSTV